MADLAKELADIERELLALTGNQPPNPAQLATKDVISVTATNPQVVKIVTPDGIPKFTRAHVISPSNGKLTMSYVAPNLEIYLYDAAPITFVVSSLGEFTLV